MQSGAAAERLGVGDRGASPEAVAARLMVPVVCKTPDILRIFGISERLFFQLRKDGKLFTEGAPVPPMTTIDASLRFSGFDVIDYVRSRGAYAPQAVEGDAQRAIAQPATGRSFFGGSKRRRRHSHEQ